MHEHQYHGCDVESIYGDIFQIGVNGGGALRVFGGSYIMDDGGSVRYLLNIAGTGLGNNNNSFTVSGIQTEMHSTNNRLVRQGPGSGGAHVVFNECNITATNGAREQVAVSTARVTFNRCVLTQNPGSGCSARTKAAINLARRAQFISSSATFPRTYRICAARRRAPMASRGGRFPRAAASTIS